MGNEAMKKENTHTSQNNLNWQTIYTETHFPVTQREDVPYPYGIKFPNNDYSKPDPSYKSSCTGWCDINEERSDSDNHDSYPILGPLSSVEPLPGFSFVYGEALEFISDTECTICMINYSPGDRLQMLPCNHVAHCACLNEWYCKSKTCPCCRR